MNRLLSAACRSQARSHSRALSTLATTIGAVIVPVVANAQTADRPQWKVGDRWTFHQISGLPATERDWSRVVEQELPEGHLRVKAGKSSLIFDGEGNSLDARGPEYSWRRFAFPMQVGNVWKHDWKIGGDTWSGYARSRWEVRAYEKLTVPAGSFDCFRVEGTIWRNTLSALAQGGVPYQVATIQVTYWYCPEVKWIAKYATREQASLSVPFIAAESVLIRYSVTN